MGIEQTPETSDALKMCFMQLTTFVINKVFSRNLMNCGRFWELCAVFELMKCLLEPDDV